MEWKVESEFHRVWNAAAAAAVAAVATAAVATSNKQRRALRTYSMDVQ